MREVVNLKRRGEVKTQTLLNDRRKGGLLCVAFDEAETEELLP